MAKVANTGIPVELPAEVLSQLDPRLKELHSQLPAILASRISVLVRAARSRRIDPNRVVRYAFLYATAERQAQNDAVSEDHTRRAKRELAGEIHGFDGGYREDVEATRLFRLGRRASQKIQASFNALLGRWRAFEQVVGKNRSELPVHVQPQFADSVLSALGKRLHNMRIAIVLDEEDVTCERNGEQNRHSVITQTYIWWRLVLKPYSGKWSDMHQLARAWRMSPSMSVKDFQTVVNRSSKGASFGPPLGSPWDSVLSEKL